MITELDRAERAVEEHSVALKKPLGLRDLVLTQILFVVGSSWVGTAAKLGQVASAFLAARDCAFLHSAGRGRHLSEPACRSKAVLYQWAKLGFNEFAGFMVAWNLWLLSDHRHRARRNVRHHQYLLRHWPSAAWMPDSKWCVSLISAPCRSVSPDLGFAACR